MDLIGCSIISISHKIPNIGCTTVPGRPIIFYILAQFVDYDSM